MSSNVYKGIKLEFHIIQSFPVTCLNRDDVNSPKTAIVGGYTRGRVSSQCWKRQVRMEMHNFGIQLAVRTKRISDKIEEYCQKKGMDAEKAKKYSDEIAKIISDNTLHFFTESEAEGLAEYAMGLGNSKVDKKEVFKIHKKLCNPAQDGFDIALFGRMVATAKKEKEDLDIQAAASFSHAITTHKLSNEVEFFTALDDSPTADDTGSSHLGTLEFNSGTYYRYVSIDIGQLYKTLLEEKDAMLKGIEAFTKALYLAVPTARQTTQAGYSRWDYAKVYIRKGQRLQASFEKPVKSQGEGYSEPSIQALKTFLSAKESLDGSLFGKIAECELGQSVSVSYNIDNLVQDIRKTIDETE